MKPIDTSPTVYRGEYSFGTVECRFKDFPYQNVFSELFDFERTRLGIRRAANYIFFFKGAPPKQRYALDLNGKTLSLGQPSQLLGLFDSILDRLIRQHTSKGTCTMHAASTAIGGNCFSFVGRSGSGKTTLATTFALHYGRTILGDEYAVFNYETGTIAHERYPLMLKRNSPLLSNIGIENAVPFTISEKTETYAVSYSQIHLEREQRELPLRALIFPHHNENIEQAAIKYVSLTNLHRFLLPSIGSTSSRANLYKAILDCISCNKIQLIQIEYNCANEASPKLADLILKQ